MKYDPSIHSKNKLGAVLHALVVPMLPTGAQIQSQGVVHLKLLGDSYVNGTLIGCVSPTLGPGIIKAVKQQPTEPSYSQSGNPWFHLDVVPAADGKSATLMAGKVKVAVCYLAPDAEIVSTDEKPDAVPDATGDDGESDNDDNDDNDLSAKDSDPKVN